MEKYFLDGNGTYSYITLFSHATDCSTCLDHVPTPVFPSEVTDTYTRVNKQCPISETHRSSSFPSWNEDTCH